MTISRRAFLNAGAAGTIGIIGGKSQTQTPTTVARTVAGQVRGEAKDGLVVFRGIPYAGSPAGPNRFKPTPKVEPWTGVRDALAYGAQSMQVADPNMGNRTSPLSSEDCLYLNVWTPGLDRKRRPVMFYSHGGGFATGNGGEEGASSHDGAALAQAYDVVVVTHNHRLGIMGYLYLGELLGEEYASSGMAGMLDIAAALRWVHDNIENFGGDPGTVMIWGESGGGAKTSVLTAMPAAKDLFHRASVESGPGLRMRSRESAAETARTVLRTLEIGEKDARKLLEVPAEQLLAASGKIPRNQPAGVLITPMADGMGSGLGFGPVVDGRNLPANPYDPTAPAVSAKVPMIVGTNRDETLFIYRSQQAVLTMDEAGLRQRLEAVMPDKAARAIEVYRKSRPGASPAELFIAMTTAQWARNDAIRMAERKIALKSAPVFMYIFAFGSGTPSPAGQPFRSGSAHASEIAFKFNHARDADGSNLRAKASRNMSRAWASFARNGNPSHDEIPDWPAYTLDRRATMILDAECKVVDDPYREERLFWA